MDSNQSFINIEKRPPSQNEITKEQNKLNSEIKKLDRDSKMKAFFLSIMIFAAIFFAPPHQESSVSFLFGLLSSTFRVLLFFITRNVFQTYSFQTYVFQTYAFSIMLIITEITFQQLYPLPFILGLITSAFILIFYVKNFITLFTYKKHQAQELNSFYINPKTPHEKMLNDIKNTSIGFSYIEQIDLQKREITIVEFFLLHQLFKKETIS